jgi:type IV pilus assembly PilN-like protein
MFPQWATSRIPVLIPGRDEISFVIGSSRNGGRHRCGYTFRFPSGSSWDDSGDLGRTFRTFLRENHLRAGRVGVVALPADWVVLRTTSLPPLADADLLPGMVAIAADELFAERVEDLAYGYEAIASDRGVDVTIAACHKHRIGRLRSFLQAAGLRAACATPLASCLAKTSGLESGEGLLVLRNAGDTEVALSLDGRVVQQRAVHGNGSVASSEADLRRVAMAMPEGLGRKMLVLGDAELVSASEAAFGLSASEVLTITSEPGEVRVELPHALATCADGAADGSMNLLTSPRLGGTTDRGPLVRRVALAGLILLILLGWFVWSWIDARARAHRAEETKTQLADRTKRAQELWDLTKASDPWYISDCSQLDALRELTLKFPEEGKIWVTSLEIDASGRISLSGRARERSDVLELLARLEDSPIFREIAQDYIRRQTGREELVSFAATCRYCKEGGS